jgi:hypothetical protein
VQLMRYALPIIFMILVYGCSSHNTEQKPAKPSPLDVITFNTAGFTTRLKRWDQRMWENINGDELVFSYFEQGGNIPKDFSSIDKVRDFYRQKAISIGGGLIEADFVQLDSCQAVKAIIKTPQHSGTTYTGYLVIPFQKFNYVINVKCKEEGLTGTRDTAIFLKMKLQGKIKIDNENGDVKGWAQDPYNPSVKGGLLRNLSEDEQYDKDFPDHPLSRLRAHTKSIESSIKIDEAIKLQSSFS